MIKNNFRILKKQYAYLQTILKTPVKFQKDWLKTVGGVADTRMVVGADGRTDGRTDGQTDGWTDGRTLKISEGIIIPRHFLVAGHKKHHIILIRVPFTDEFCITVYSTVTKKVYPCIQKLKKTVMLLYIHQKKLTFGCLEVTF